jgi:hypothetical protein
MNEECGKKTRKRRRMEEEEFLKRKKKVRNKNVNLLETKMHNLNLPSKVK